MSDCVVGEPEALAAVDHVGAGACSYPCVPATARNWSAGLPGRPREGLWVVVIVMGDGSDDDETVAMARRHADSVVVHEVAG